MKKVEKSIIEQGRVEREKAIFGYFLDSGALPSGTYMPEAPPAPDILYCGPDGIKIAFELTAATNSDLARMVSAKQKWAIKADGSEPPDYASSFSDAVVPVLRKKSRKQYKSDHPLHLLIYTDGLCITPDDAAISYIQIWADAFHRPSPFEKIWFMGDGKPVVAWERAKRD